LYKKETEPEQKKSSLPRFRVTWEGQDTSATEKEPPVPKKESFLNRFFKKK
jgi:hypothetical protein